MPKSQVFHLQPFEWEGDPEEERYKISTLDYLAACTYNTYALFFRLNDADKSRAIDVLKHGLERTIGQARHLCATIEKDPEGGHSFVKKKDSTVQFFIQWLDSPEDSYPSFDDMKKSNFSSVTLGDLALWSVPPMTYGEKPEAHPDNSPVASAFKANFVRGGLVFCMHHHHYADDLMGWVGYTRQLAENCCALVYGTAFPSWDPASLDLSRLIKKEPPEEAKIEGPPPPERHPDHTVAEFLLFHLPRSKAAELKKLAMPTDGSWVSTYDAFSAFIWRNLSRLRAPVFKPDMSSKLFWSQAVDMRRRLHSPKVPPRIQHNVMSAALSTTAPVEQPTVAQVISEWPLSQLALYVRKMTDSVTQENLDEALNMAATVRDKTALNIRIDSFPPMSILQTDHRDACMTGVDFGFATPAMYRNILDCVTEGVVIVYPPRNATANSDEGCEFSIAYEKALAHDLINDPEWNMYFEYRGVDAVDARHVAASQAKSNGMVEVRLAEGSAKIDDALVRLKYPYGGFLDGIRMFSPGSKARVSGPAITVQMVELSDNFSPSPEKHFADYNENGSIMYIQQPKGLPSACWGGLMSTRAKFLGAEATVVDGRIRDVGEHIEMGYPVFARDSSILGSNTFTRASRVNVPLQFKGDLWINPGDILIGDADGMVVLPPSLVEQVIGLCQERAEMDEKMFVELRKGEAMGPLIKSIRERQTEGE
ncbi:Trichothecene 3-o-acetyltransferase [Pleurostoma richardsiae]|uniref:Trichothecene 3-o-acetyltransferase n=1 Tax=Pleurostoma richardsiae TaxID=41990 RepID=A0AA38RTH9_9PEZI|nr:Trichothecene 3-o-acetyltransferase [Pleurostoma richardsiae]